MIKKSICKHYKRNCDKKAPCCQIYYPCRLCHDENYKGPKSEGCKTETMDRYNVKEIRCRECLTEQAPSKECTNCKIQFARYYCETCKLYDDDPKKQIYHCDKCKMCRKGRQEDNFHCDVCDICLSLSIKNDHKCTEKAFEQNCAVCQEYLKNSTKFVQQLTNCAHFIHIDCLNQSLKKGLRNCPNCNVAIYKMEKEEIEHYDQIAEMLSKEFDEETKNKVVNIVCMDCQKKSENVPFNVYVKCQHCGSYNTRN